MSMNNGNGTSAETRVAVLVDCDNTSPEIQALVRLAFTPCLQFQYAAGKKITDIASSPASEAPASASGKTAI